MLLRKLNQLPDDRVVEGETWRSRRLLLREDRMGFSLHDTIILAGTSTHIHYANHLEAVYCIEGAGRVRLVESGEVFEIEAGTVYALDKNDEHMLEADSDMRMICVFNPALVGPETHDENGVYPILPDEADPSP